MTAGSEAVTTGSEVRSLTSYPPGLTTNQLHEATSLTEHSRRQAVADGLLVPVEIGRKMIWPRHQVFALLGLIDPDVAAADAVRESMVSDLGRSKAPPESEAPDIHVLPARATGEVAL